VSKRKALSDIQINLIAEALADPRRYEILKRIGASSGVVSCAEVRECHPVSAAKVRAVRDLARVSKF